MIFCFQAGNNRHEHIMESLELFGREVLPEFMERDEKLQRDKAQRLAPVLDKVMARKPAERPPAAADRPTTRSPPSRARWPTASDNDDFQKMLDDFAQQAATPGGLEGLFGG